jgi:5-methylthioadenosine/S-adenosylhomocysteine deaminase
MKSLFAALVIALLTAAPEPTAEPIDLLITGATVVTMDSLWNVYEDGYVAIRNGRIVGVGELSGFDQGRYRPGDVVDAGGNAILPGLINTHTHAPMSLFRGLADDLELEDWLNNYMFPAEREYVTRGFVAAGTRLALAEMILGGTTTFADMYYFEDHVARETARAGVRAVLGQVVVDFPAPDNETWEEALRDVEEFVEEWKRSPLITPAIAPHAPYTVGTEHLEEVRELAERLDIPVLMHIAEAPSETGYTLKHFQASPVVYLDSIGLLSPRLIGAHLIHVNDHEIELLAQNQVGVAHCPQSNMKLATGVAPVPEMLKAGLRVGLGTDGAASNNNLDMWEEMDTAAKLHKVVTDDPTVVPARQALQMATIGGARALHLEDEIGSLEVGKSADLIVVNLNAPHVVPMYNIYSHLVYAAKASDVIETMVAGRVLMRDRRLLTINEDKVKSDAIRYARPVRESLQSNN